MTTVYLTVKSFSCPINKPCTCPMSKRCKIKFWFIDVMPDIDHVHDTDIVKHENRCGLKCECIEVVNEKLLLDSIFSGIDKNKICLAEHLNVLIKCFAI